MERQWSAQPGARLEPERLKFITEYLSGAPWLFMAALGLCLFLSSAQEVSHLPWSGSFLVWSVSFLVFVFAFRYLPKYHERRFGRIEPKGMTPLQAMITGALIILIPIFLIGWLIVALVWGPQLDLVVSQFESWFARTIQLPLNAYLLGVWLLGFTSLRKFRFDPFRPYFCLLGTIATSVVVFFPYWCPPAKGFLTWKILNAGWLGLSMVAFGLYHHFLLVHFMPKEAGDDDDEC